MRMLHSGQLKVCRIIPPGCRVVADIEELEILFSSDDRVKLSRAELSQPLCTALQIVIVDFLASWGVTPSAVIGHSSGEIAAAYAAGALSKEGALIAAFYRGFVCRNFTQAGAMAAIGLGKTEVLPHLVRDVGVACENSGSSLTLSGNSEPLEQVMSAIKSHHPQAFIRKLQVDMAYHSGKISLLPLRSIADRCIRPHENCRQ